jgi:DNA-binding IscR family transcriptional regulator
MKLTVFSDYSLRVLIYLAAQPKQRATIPKSPAPSVCRRIMW